MSVRRCRFKPADGAMTRSCCAVSRSLTGSWLSLKPGSLIMVRVLFDQQRVDGCQISLAQAPGLLFQCQDIGQIVIACLTVGPLRGVVVVLRVQQIELASRAEVEIAPAGFHRAAA